MAPYKNFIAWFLIKHGMHREVIENLENIHGALLRMHRSIRAEGIFGIMKNDRWYKRIGLKKAP